MRKHLGAWGARPLWLEDLGDLPAPILQLAPVLQICITPRRPLPSVLRDQERVAGAIQEQGRAVSFFGPWRRTVVVRTAGTWVVNPDSFTHLDGPVSRGLRGSGRLESGDALAFEALDHEDGWIPQDFDLRSNAEQLEASARRLLSALWIDPVEAAGPLALTARLGAVGARLVMAHSRFACSRQVRLPSIRIAQVRPVVLPDASALTGTDEVVAQITTGLRRAQAAASGRHAARPHATRRSMDSLRGGAATSAF